MKMGSWKVEVHRAPQEKIRRSFDAAKTTIRDIATDTASFYWDLRAIQLKKINMYLQIPIDWIPIYYPSCLVTNHIKHTTRDRALWRLLQILRGYSG